jgi:hypothetical protein
MDAMRARVLLLVLPAAIVVGLFATSLSTNNQLRYYLSTFGEIPPRVAELIIRNELLPVFASTGLFGHGTGSNSQAIGYFASTAQRATLGDWETGIARIAWELGIVGLFVYLLVVARLLWNGWAVCRALIGTDLYYFGFCILVYQLIVFGRFFIVGHHILGSSETLVYLWLSAGILFGLVRVAQVPALAAAGGERASGRRAVSTIENARERTPA